MPSFLSLPPSESRQAEIIFTIQPFWLLSELSRTCREHIEASHRFPSYFSALAVGISHGLVHISQWCPITQLGGPVLAFTDEPPLPKATVSVALRSPLSFPSHPQAVTCSCFIPLYFGFSPPTYRGVVSSSVGWRPCPAPAQGPSSLWPFSSGGIKDVSTWVCHQRSSRLCSHSVCRGKNRAPKSDLTADRTQLLTKLSIFPCPWGCLSCLLLHLPPASIAAVLWLEGRIRVWTWSRGAAGGAVPWKGISGAPEPQAAVGLGGEQAPRVCPCEQHCSLCPGEGSGLPVLSPSATWTASWPCGQPTSCPAPPSPSLPSPENTTSAPRTAQLPS